MLDSFSDSKCFKSTQEQENPLQEVQTPLSLFAPECSIESESSSSESDMDRVMQKEEPEQKLIQMKKRLQLFMQDPE